MSRITDLSREVKFPVFTVDDWITVRRGRVIWINGPAAGHETHIIVGSAKENGVPVAEMHAAIIAFALLHGREDLVTCGKIIRWWRRQRKSLRSQF